MATPHEEEEEDQNPNESNNEDEEHKDEGEEEKSEDIVRNKKAKLRNLLLRLSKERVSIRVHDVIIKGNTKTKESLLEPEMEYLKKATSVQELLLMANAVKERLVNLDIFDAVTVLVDSGPPELPGTANVVVQVVEPPHPFTGELGIFQVVEARSSTFEGTLKCKNLFGYGDIWDGSCANGWGEASEISTGVLLPRFKGIQTPVTARVALRSQDWLKVSSYEERSLGLSLGLLSTIHHDLSYNLIWRTLTDPSQMSSRSVRMQLGHSLISSLKYKFSIDERDSSLRPTKGYAFVSNTQIAGVTPDSRSLRFIRQEFDLRYAFPLGFYNAALNLGISVGAIFPWGSGSMNMSSPLSERFFLSGKYSPVCTLGGPRALLGFKSRGLGPTEMRRLKVDKSDNGSSASFPGRDLLGGDLAFTAFANLSFNLPLKVFRDAGIHGHLFACSGNLTKLSENEFRNFTVKSFGESFRTSAGAGIVIPTKFFRLEINYCYILKQLQHDQSKKGIQFSFGSSE